MALELLQRNIEKIADVIDVVKNIQMAPEENGKLTNWEHIGKKQIEYFLGHNHQFRKHIHRYNVMTKSGSKCSYDARSNSVINMFIAAFYRSKRYENDKKLYKTFADDLFWKRIKVINLEQFQKKEDLVSVYKSETDDTIEKNKKEIEKLQENIPKELSEKLETMRKIYKLEMENREIGKEIFFSKTKVVSYEELSIEKLKELLRSKKYHYGKSHIKLTGTKEELVNRLKEIDNDVLDHWDHVFVPHEKAEHLAKEYKFERILPPMYREELVKYSKNKTFQFYNAIYIRFFFNNIIQEKNKKYVKTIMDYCVEINNQTDFSQVCDYNFGEKFEYTMTEKTHLVIAKLKLYSSPKHPQYKQLEYDLRKVVKDYKKELEKHGVFYVQMNCENRLIDIEI